MNKNRLTIVALPALLALLVLSCVAAEAAVPASVSGGSLTAQGAMQAGLAGVVASSDVQSQVEGDSAADWELYQRTRAKARARDCVNLERNKDPRIGSCTAYHCSDVGELTIVCELIGDEDNVLFTYANSAGCFTWSMASRKAVDAERIIRDCVYVTTL